MSNMPESIDAEAPRHDDVPDPGDDERRTAPRVRFTTDVPISGWNGRCLPPDDEFLRVQAVNLSHSGIAFYSYVKPPSRSLVIMMGNPKTPTYTSARVVRCTREGNRYLVACEFLRKIWQQC